MKKFLIIIFTITMVIAANYEAAAQVREKLRIGRSILRDEGDSLVSENLFVTHGAIHTGVTTFQGLINVGSSQIILAGNNILGSSNITLTGGFINLTSGSVYKLNGTNIQSIFAGLSSPNVFSRVQNFDTINSTGNFNLNFNGTNLLQITDAGSWMSDHYDFFAKGVKRFRVDNDSNKVQIFSGDNEISLWNNSGVLDINAPLNVHGGISAENLTVSGSLDLTSATIEGFPSDTTTYIKKYGDFTKENDLYVGGILHADTINFGDGSLIQGSSINVFSEDFKVDVGTASLALGDDGIDFNSPSGYVRLLSSTDIFLESQGVISLKANTQIYGTISLDTIVGNIYSEGNNIWKGENTFSKIQTEVFASVPLSVSNDTVFASSGTNFKKTLSANTTFKLKGISDGQTITFAVTNTTGNYTSAWTSLDGLTIYWPGNSAPAQTAGNHVDVYTFKRIGSDIYGSVVQNYK